jgi:hypothetical protein
MTVRIRIMSPTEGKLSVAEVNARITDLERRAKFTGNPLYVWQCILECLTSEQPLSPLCLSEIKTVAMQLDCLMHDYDSISQSKQEGESELQFASRLGSAYENAMPKQDAVKYVTDALGITGGMHKNAFNALRTDMEDCQWASIADARLNIPKGLPTDRRDNLVNYLKKSGAPEFMDDSHIRQRQARGRKLNNTPRPKAGRPSR